MIEFKKIGKSYLTGGQSVDALKGVDGQIRRGEMVALCGPSGSGKSTLLNILGLLDMDYRGEINIAGKAYPTEQIAAARFRRQSLGFVFQRFNLVPVMTALENVSYPLMLNQCTKQEQQTRAQDILERVGLGEYIHHRPDNLSGGQQQRVAIARALVHSPSLVIADEPTASLDSYTANLVIDIMKELGHEMGTTFIVATHDPRMAQRCDRVIELIDGQLSSQVEAMEAISWAS
ncbi:ABC transporter ATP-binding protein [Vibrio sp. 070316B]|uniref:ABC transporter ATP-binding protein n=1 Tax=unclassified Vibrio TaxID=2614977 RepID=UPI001493D510|nr:MULTISPECIES: ABC transporter ATP-binding protein [unclassified Vibrio]CAH6849934.1 Lipoprotein-releasing system ATP-binding protein LolD [Vibrio chagasii]NOI37466.1 ABC transporter ATP-binding protein [Vibrio sp. 070316B]NOI88664.1 ABC transporter ATP-binding protein [Vibrio sp. 99K-1]CAH6856127.1 Lipoprotein-releasing system ATP-binding protein LolD [Vibrio chagasii]CAH7135225.1 Lipoprotein-releasing system ATP-binding protein LolD [Vibrio chagasii]